MEHETESSEPRSVREIFETRDKMQLELREAALSPELIEKIIDAFIALEALLAEAFPYNRYIKWVLAFLAEYVARFFR